MQNVSTKPNRKGTAKVPLEPNKRLNNKTRASREFRKTLFDPHVVHNRHLRLVLQGPGLLLVVRRRGRPEYGGEVGDPRQQALAVAAGGLQMELPSTIAHNLSAAVL